LSVQTPAECDLIQVASLKRIEDEFPVTPRGKLEKKIKKDRVCTRSRETTSIQGCCYCFGGVVVAGLVVAGFVVAGLVVFGAALLPAAGAGTPDWTL
jgi:hypothetical protein